MTSTQFQNLTYLASSSLSSLLDEEGIATVCELATFVYINTPNRPKQTTVEGTHICLRINNTHSPVKQQYIFVGELLVWNEQSQTIMPFYKIRRHVLRAGHRIGCAQDYPPSREEHLMVMLYDVLLYGDIDYLCTHMQVGVKDWRRSQPRPRRVDISTSTEIDFKRPDATHRLRHLTANSNRTTLGRFSTKA